MERNHHRREPLVIAVTGATGHLGRLVVDNLLQTVPAGEIVAAVRDPGRAADLAGRGVVVRHGDYDDAGSWKTALEGVDTLLLISGSEVGRRIAQHRTVIDAARDAGVGRIAYTSVLGADTTTLRLAPEHQATERLIRDSGLPFTLLRNGFYTEVYAPVAQQAIASGTLIGSAGTGRVASATRADFAAAAAVVLTGAGHENAVYELSGDTAWTFAELAEAISAATGTTVTYRDLSPEDHRAALLGAGLPAETADLLVGLDEDIKAGTLAATPGELSLLIGRPTAPLPQGLL
jgi:NAD(P)H dehydrogenase (quinone)